MKKLVLMLVVSSLLVVGSVGQAVVIMDATHCNGAMTNASGVNGPWYTPGNEATGWGELLGGYGGYQIMDRATSAQGGGSQFSSVYAAGFYNTGYAVQTGQQFTIQADMGANLAGWNAAEVWATQNVDGTGTAVLLADVANFANGIDHWVYYTVVGTQGAPAAASVNGYFVQVKLLGGNQGFYDNIVVTATPEPATLALLGLGGLFLRKRK